MPTPPSNDASGGSPTGIVTLLYSDIESSSKLWERYHDAVPHLLARYGEIVHSLVEAHHGNIFDAGVGAFSAAFTTASHAVAAAIGIQEAVRRENWNIDEPLQVRIALHTGLVEIKGGIYSGSDVDQATQLLNVAHGGAIILSQFTTDLVAGHLPDGVALTDIVNHRLGSPDLAESIYKLELVATEEIDPLFTPEVPSHNLPKPFSSFIGRKKERDKAAHLLRATRVVTFTGAAGCGKTRLAIQVAYDIKDDFIDGAWLVDFAGLTDARLVSSRVAAVLGVGEKGDLSLTELLLRHLRDKHLLLVLDNCEHVKEECLKLVDSILHACPKIRVLATSREAIHITGEAAWSVPSFSVPARDRQRDLDAYTNYEALNLFVERAGSAAHGFRLTMENAPTIMQICRRLDGIPLAIELAAARIATLTLEEIAAGLVDRFRLLTSDDSKQTLREAIDWSYRLLDEQEKTLLQRVSVFRGGWTLEAAEGICSDEDNPLPYTGKTITAADVIEILNRLVDKSLATVEEYAGAARYRLLESMREYSRDRLVEAGDSETLSNRHLSWYLQFAEEAASGLRGPQEEHWIHYLEVELDNIRIALAWARESEPQLRMTAALWNFWYILGRLTEGHEWLNRALAHSQAGPTSLRALALTGAGAIATAQGDVVAARNYFEESLQIRMALGDRHGQAVSHSNLAMLETKCENFDKARRDFEASLTAYRELNDTTKMLLTLINLGGVATYQRDYLSARGYLEQAIQIEKIVDNKRLLAHILHNIGLVALKQGYFEEAYEKMTRSLRLMWKLKDLMVLASALAAVASIALRLGIPSRAARLFGAADALREEVGATLQDSELKDYDSEIALLRQLMDEHDFEAEYFYGRNMTLENAVGYALLPLSNIRQNL